MYRVKSIFPSFVLKQLYYSLAYPYLIYCILAWGKTSLAVLNPLIILQKRLIRLIAGSEYLAHTSPLFKALSLLKFHDIYSLSVLVYMFKTLVLNKYPNMLSRIYQLQPNHYYNTRNDNFILPRCLNKCKQSLLYQGISLWNSIPLYMKSSLSLCSFKRNWKSFVLMKY